jgi:hypothetical protein
MTGWLTILAHALRRQHRNDGYAGYVGNKMTKALKAPPDLPGAVVTARNGPVVTLVTAVSSAWPLLPL